MPITTGAPDAKHSTGFGGSSIATLLPITAVRSQRESGDASPRSKVALSNQALWQAQLEKPRQNDRMFGVVFATSRVAVNDFAKARGVPKLSNVNGCPG
jgi:hypothetical protein